MIQCSSALKLADAWRAVGAFEPGRAIVTATAGSHTRMNTAEHSGDHCTRQFAAAVRTIIVAPTIKRSRDRIIQCLQCLHLIHSIPH